ncbi:HypC/HybG/HupF family hydrogenase formation chaperone [Candidatus Micrarchaeota archaeon]|nr:HypC/HybG/HupF family hydrogenase formation chaperone [Candidatus Micrarchaeota archaeon]
MNLVEGGRNLKASDLMLGMCLAIPGKIVALKNEGRTAIVSYGREKREADNSITHSVVGEWVLVQQRVVVEKLTEQDAEEALAGWRHVTENERG